MCSWSQPSEDRESLNGPHTKILEKKERKEMPNKGILLMVLNNGVMQGSHGHGRVRGSHECACEVDTWFPWMAYERLMDDALMK